MYLVNHLVVLSKDILARPSSIAAWRMQDVVPLRELCRCSQRGNFDVFFLILRFTDQKLTHTCLFWCGLFA